MDSLAFIAHAEGIEMIKLKQTKTPMLYRSVQLLIQL